MDRLDAGAEYTVVIKAYGYEPTERKAVPTAAGLTLAAIGLEKA